MTNTTKESQVFELTVELDDMMKKKKATVKGFNEEIKRLKAEIKDLIDPPKEDELP
jgi:predicted Rdx family selenoprotein